LNFCRFPQVATFANQFCNECLEILGLDSSVATPTPKLKPDEDNVLFHRFVLSLCKIVCIQCAFEIHTKVHPNEDALNYGLLRLQSLQEVFQSIGLKFTRSSPLLRSAADKEFVQQWLTQYDLRPLSEFVRSIMLKYLVRIRPFEQYQINRDLELEKEISPGVFVQATWPWIRFKRLFRSLSWYIVVFLRYRASFYYPGGQFEQQAAKRFKKDILEHNIL
jgi:hypothetical protein